MVGLLPELAGLLLHGLQAGGEGGAFQLLQNTQLLQPIRQGGLRAGQQLGGIIIRRRRILMRQPVRHQGAQGGQSKIFIRPKFFQHLARRGGLGCVGFAEPEDGEI